MSTDINFLLKTDEESLKRRKRIKILNAIAIISLIIVVSISLGIFVLIQAANPLSIKNEQNVVLGKISQFQTRQAKLFAVNDRIENIDKILKIRKDLSNTMNELLAKVPSGMSINDFEIDDKSVIISGRSNSLYAIGEFINNLSNMAYQKGIIKSLTLNSLSLDLSSNTYQVSIKSDL